MFRIEKKAEEGFDKVILIDEDGGCRVEIAPACGAVMVGYKVFHQGELLNVIDHYQSEKDFHEHVTSKGFLGAKLSPFVCRIKDGEYKFQGDKYKLEKFYLGKNALHGLVYDHAFELTNEDANEQVATVSMRYNYEASDPGYPFRYNIMVTYSLAAGNKLTVSTRVMNTGERPIPMQDGWHPYFNLGNKLDELELKFLSKDLVEFDEELIPTGKLIPYDQFTKLKKIGDQEFDNCFSLDFNHAGPKCILSNPKKNIHVEVYPDESYPFLQLYTPPHRQSIAIENISGAPDAFNNGMGVQLVKPGEFANFSTAYIVNSSTWTHE